MHRHMQKYIMYVLKSTNTNSYLDRDTSMLMKYTHVHRKLHVVHVRARQAYKWINTHIEFHTHDQSEEEDLAGRSISIPFICYRLLFIAFCVSVCVCVCVCVCGQGKKYSQLLLTFSSISLSRQHAEENCTSKIQHMNY